MLKIIKLKEVMKAQEWREKSEGEREKAILELKDKARTLRFDLATRETKIHSEYGKIKKDIARLMTLKQEATLSINVD
ncbi:MAG: 50S ribosomal protein L29 [Candidatus Moranbacteria bacterium CG_4_10_14_3_um_filter_41_65]|nr:MAG: 50S ribosomal protein L29 [Candidatus Moranbacteria bacterium CG23_combo_of_CG06-09_8_20_14_all_41_28]PIV85912.1 MAG: 50S ribosomal protein L29 [Candidatus Moranbacteria bacterium CG17_big_fil_post_rev_8_21_14_2_50_41_107]PIW94090.1 MAG: 50S ribosomal protein L29 [Candidatus Moranbacteria bacterium CG_4_8_14_3_um_filter_41_13]PIX91166.1 MAG: 50S ribosomal protein L29 [Candidatus Moranbacteria bacterium CG_4_10_14_3_um_filter_41_65]PJC00318.1 MAG: 50S ribosomal protein L29 [Candidatus Mo